MDKRKGLSEQLSKIRNSIESPGSEDTAPEQISSDAASIRSRLAQIDDKKTSASAESSVQTDAIRRQRQEMDLAKAKADVRISNAASYVLTAFGTAIAGAAVYSFGRWLSERVSK